MPDGRGTKASALEISMLEFLANQPDGSAMASEVATHVLASWSADDVWLTARDNPHLFVVRVGDHELPPETRVVRLVRPTTS